MTPYFVLAAAMLPLVAASSLVNGRGGTAAARWTPWDAVLALVLITFSGARWHVGTDFNAYRSLYLKLPNLDLWTALSVSPYESGFTTLSWIIKNASQTNSTLPFFMVCAAFTVVPVMISLKLSSPSFGLSMALYVLLGFFAMSMNIVRQGIAMALLMLAFSLLPRRRFAAVSVAALAVSMHLTAVLVIAIYLASRRLSLRAPTALVAWTGFVAVGFTILRFTDLHGILSRYGGPKYATYLASEGAGFGTMLRAALFLVVALVGLHLATQRANAPDRLQETATMVLIGSALVASGVVVTEVARLGDYLVLFAVLVVPMSLTLIRQRALATYAVAVVGIAYFAMVLIAYYGLIPYAVDPTITI